MTIAEVEERGALLCVQGFLRSPHFFQGNLFSDSAFATFTASAAICDSITSSAVFEPWSQVETAFRSRVVAEIVLVWIKLWIIGGQSRFHKNSGMR